MKELSPLQTSLNTLYTSFENSPVIKALIQIIITFELPVLSVVDSYLNRYLNNIKTERLYTFFEELNSYEAIISEDTICSNDFLHANFSTINYVIRTKSNEKIINFARILNALSCGKIDIDEFEDYTSIFNELSEREFGILVIKFQFENKKKSNLINLNPLQITSNYWHDFKKEVCLKLNINYEELNPMIVRLQRTGCYTKYKGYWDESSEEIGYTTELFNRIYQIIENE
ncbi:MAG: hypothetical protein ACOYMA_19810 [Bacteroidia bacterium]